MDDQPAESQDYIRLMSLVEAIRTMPAMYIGGTGKRALHEAIWQLVKFSVSEILAKDSGELKTGVGLGNVVTISDDGKGLPINTEPLKSWLFPRIQHQRMQPIGNRSIGLAIPCALAEHFVIQSKRGGFVWEQQYRRGEPQGEVKNVRPLVEDEHTGTTLTFQPDYLIFEPVDIDHDLLYQRLRELAFLQPGLTITFEDHREAAKHPSSIFYYPHGVSDFVLFLNRDYTALHEPISVETSLVIEDEADVTKTYEIIIEIAIQYVDTSESLIISFVNGLETSEGTHVKETLDALTNVIRRHAKSISWHDWRETDFLSGLTAVISIWHPRPHYAGSFRYEFASTDLEDGLYSAVNHVLDAFIASSPDAMERIVAHCSKGIDLRQRRRSE